MRIELRVSGGVAGVRRPPLVVDTAGLDARDAAELEDLAARVPLGPGGAPPGPDRFQYDLVIDGRSGTLYEGAMPPAAVELVERVRALARGRD